MAFAVRYGKKAPWTDSEEGEKRDAEGSWKSPGVGGRVYLYTWTVGRAGRWRRAVKGGHGPGA